MGHRHSLLSLSSVGFRVQLLLVRHRVFAVGPCRCDSRSLGNPLSVRAVGV